MSSQKKVPKLAITGIDVLAGSSNTDTFERLIYEGKQNFITPPPNRWQNINDKVETELPLGGYLNQFEVDLQRYNLSVDEVERLNPHELLMLKVADEALRDARISRETKVAVVTTIANQNSIQKLAKQLHTIPSQKNTSSDRREYPNHTQSSASERISRLWQFTAPAFTLTAEENSAFKALEVAHNLLLTGEADAVVVGAVDLAGSSNALFRNHGAALNRGTQTLSYDKNADGWIVGEGAGAVVLKLQEKATQDCDRIYAVIDAISLLPQHTSADSSPALTQVCQSAFQIADIQPQDIGYLELHASGIQTEDAIEIKSLLAAYQNVAELSCAIGSIKANIGHTYAAAEIFSLIKTALCLYYRYIPATPQWTSPKNPELWKGSPFYVATESKPWFNEQANRQRFAAINSIALDGSYAHLILSEPSRNLTLQLQNERKYLTQMPFYLFAIAADCYSDLITQLESLQQRINDCFSLEVIATQTFRQFQKRSDAAYALAILGRSRDDLSREIQRAMTGVKRAFEQCEDWQTPTGSYFTAQPLGKKGAIAYVYPGAFNSYIGISRSLFRLFPQIYDDIVIQSACDRVAKIEKILYPRSLSKLSKRKLEHLEQQLLNDPLAMLESEMGYAGLVTTIFKNYFQVKPQSAFGYSLGETSMMFSQGVWTDFQKCSNALNSSSLFTTRLTGSKDAVREHWGLINKQESIAWSTYVLMASATQVKDCIKQENQVYLTQINTPKEVVIAGETQACLRLIEKLNCDAFSAPFNHAIHCEAMQSEYPELVRIKTLPIQNIPDTVFYSAAEYAPLTLTSEAIAHHIAKCLCQQVDFPKLVNRVYDDGTRIFLEVGAGSNCSRWIDESLKNQEHITVSVNRRGVDDHTSILKALAKLLSHRVALNLSPLYSQLPSEVNSTTTKAIAIKDLNLAQSSTNHQSAIPNEETLMQAKTLTPILEVKDQPVIDHLSHSHDAIAALAVDPVQSSSVLVSSPNSNFTQFTSNNHHATQIHEHFLQARQQALRQMSKIMQLQIACSQHITNQNSQNIVTPALESVNVAIR